MSEKDYTEKVWMDKTWNQIRNRSAALDPAITVADMREACRLLRIQPPDEGKHERPL